MEDQALTLCTVLSVLIVIYLFLMAGLGKKLGFTATEISEMELDAVQHGAGRTCAERGYE